MTRWLVLLVALLAFTAIPTPAQTPAGSYFNSFSEPLPNCTPGGVGVRMPVAWDITAQKFMYCSATNTWTQWSNGGGGGGGVCGADTQVQFNDAGACGASANFTFNKTLATEGVGKGFGDGTLASDVGFTSTTASPISLLVGTHITDTVNASNHHPAGGASGCEYTGSATLTNSSCVGLYFQALQNGPGTIGVLSGVNGLGYNKLGTLLTEVNGVVGQAENDGTAPIIHAADFTAYSLGTTTDRNVGVHTSASTLGGTVPRNLGVEIDNANFGGNVTIENAGLYVHDIHGISSVANYGIHVLNQGTASTDRAIQVDGGLSEFDGGTKWPGQKKLVLPFALCAAGATPAAAWDTPASSSAVAACKVGGTNNTVQGVLQFADAQTAYYSGMVPADWLSWGTARISFTTSDTTNGHTIIFKLALACDAPNGGLTDDPAYGANNAFTTVTIGGGAVANASYQTNTAAVTGGGCAAGSLVHWKLFRDTDTSSDTAVAVTGWLEVNYQAQYQ